MRPLVQVQPGPPDRLSPAEMPVGDRCRSRVLAPLLTHSGHRAHYSRAETDPQMKSHKDRVWDGLAAPPGHASEPGSVCNSSHAHCWSRPSRCATAAASPRPATPSLARMWETCRLAVFSMMNRVSPVWSPPSSPRRAARLDVLAAIATE